MGRIDYAELAHHVKPYVTKWLTVGPAAGGGGGGGTVELTAHPLNSTWHSGTLAQTQAPWAVPNSRQVIAGDGMQGGGALSGDVTLTVGAGTLITVDAETVSLASGTAQYQVPVTGATPFAPAWTGLGTFAGAGLAFSGGAFAVGVANTGAAGLSVEADLVRLTSSSDVGTTPAAAILASTAQGRLTLDGLVAKSATGLTGLPEQFATGFTGYGWRADYGVTTAGRASIETDDLTVRGRMRVYELLIQQIRATNGSLLVTSSSKVVSVTAQTNPTWTVNGLQLTFNGANATFATTLYTIDTAAAGDTSRSLYHGFLYGDIIRAQQTQWDGAQFAGVIQSNLEVTSVTSLTRYTATLVSGNAAAVGYDYVRLGNTVDVSRRGVVYLTSDDSAAPFIDIIDGIRYHSDFNTPGTNKARLGKLSGISDSAFGGALSGYGLYSNNVFLRGQIVVTGGSLGGLAAADVNSNTTTIDGGKITANSVTAAQIAANTITAGQIAAGTITATEIAATTITGAKIAANTITAAKIAAGTITATEIAANTITGAKLSLTTTIAINDTTFGNKGIQLDYNAGNPRFYAGDGNQNFIRYNGTNVSITGFVTATGGNFTGAVYCGSNAVRFSTDGQRLVLPNIVGANVNPDPVTSPSAFRWFSGIDQTWADTNNYVGVMGYRHQTYQVVDLLLTSYVGSTDATNYDSRIILQAGHNRGGTYEDATLVVARNRGTGDGTITANCTTFTASNNVYVTNNCSVGTFTDRTPHYDGDAIAELRAVSGKTVKGKREIDHASLPAVARKRVRRPDGTYEDGRDIGAMISVLTKAVQQLDARLDAIGA